MEKPSQAVTLTKRPKSWETLKIYTHKHVYVMTKWETIDHLITTLGLIVILHMSLYTFISNNAVFIYSTLVCITGNFPLCDLPSAMIFKLHPLVYRSSGFCCVHPSFSSCCDSKNYSWESFPFFFYRRLICLQFLQISPSTKEWAHVSHAPETLMDNVPLTKSFSQDKPSPHYEKMAQIQCFNEPHKSFSFFCEFESVTATYVSKERRLHIVPDCASFSFRSTVIYWSEEF